MAQWIIWSSISRSFLACPSRVTLSREDFPAEALVTTNKFFASYAQSTVSIRGHPFTLSSRVLPEDIDRNWIVLSLLPFSMIARVVPSGDKLQLTRSEATANRYFVFPVFFVELIKRLLLSNRGAIHADMRRRTGALVVVDKRILQNCAGRTSFKRDGHHLCPNLALSRGRINNLIPLGIQSWNPLMPSGSCATHVARTVTQTRRSHRRALLESYF